jgi:hypothetical protein
MKFWRFGLRHAETRRDEETQRRKKERDKCTRDHTKRREEKG